MPPLFDDLYLITPKLAPAHPDEVDALAGWLGTELPACYARYATTLGAGTYCGRLMVWMPAQIREQCDDERAFVREYFDDFWGEDSAISMAEAAEGVPFASTVDGDKVFYSLPRRKLFVLPRHGERVLWMPQGLVDPLNWGQPNTHEGPRYFDSHIDRAIVEHFSSTAITDTNPDTGSDTLPATIENVATCIARHFPPAHRINAAWGARLFLPDIQGTAQLTQAPGDTRVGVRLEFDQAAASRMLALWPELAALGLRETWRSPSTPKP